MKCNIDWNVFWNAFGSIATSSAVCVALWQTKYANKKKAKLSFVDKMTIVPTVPIGTMGYMPKNQYVGIDFANIGNRKIIIKSFWIELPDGCHAVIQPDATPIGTLSWPIELDVEESVFLPWQKDKFINYLKSNKSLAYDKRIVFCVSDSLGVVYKCKTQKTVQQYLT